jgi:[ribosomal protein S5]-alanine N-acetyltransferase
MRHTQPFPALATARLELRAINAGDASFYHELLLLAEVTRFSDLPDAASPARATRIVTWMSKLFPNGKGCGWIIQERSNGARVGAVRINHIDKRWRWGDIGYEAYPEFWGRGFMTEAVRAVVACGHNHFRLNRMEAWTLPGNDASDRVLVKAGFVYEGTLRQKAWFKGAYHDFRMFGRIERDPINLSNPTKGNRVPA